MASSTSTPAPSISRTAPPTSTNPTSSTFSPPSTPAQLFYGARGRSGSIASSFARQQASNSNRDRAQSPPIPPLPTSHSLPHHHGNGHNHTSSIGSFSRSATFPTLASPVRGTFPGSPVRSTFGESLPPIKAGESFSFPHHPSTNEPLSPLRSAFAEPPSPSKPTRNPSPLGHSHTHGHTPSLALPPSTRAYSPSPSHARSSSTVAEQIPLGRLPSKQSKEALLPAGHTTRTGAGKSPSSSPSFAMFFGAGKRASMGFGAKGSAGGEGERKVEVIGVEKTSDEPETSMEQDKEKGWGDSVGGTRTPRESIVRFTRSRSHSESEGRSSGERPLPLPSPTPQPGPRESGFTDGPMSQSRPSESSRAYVRRPAGTWHVDSGPVVRDKKTGRIVRRHEVIESESRWFCRGWLVTGGGTRRVPVKERKAHPYAAGKPEEADGDGWAYSDGTAYVYDGPHTGSSGPHTTASTNAGTTTKLNDVSAGKSRTKRGRFSLVPYPFVFSVLLVLGTAGAWIGTTCIWWWKHESPALAAVGAWLVLLVVVSMARTAFTDPGIIPRNLDLSPAMEDETTPYARDLYVRGIPVRVKYCMTCKTYRPLRSSHCRICDNCVDGCDHHCQWVNNCVGRRNYTAFITFLIACFLAILLMGVTAALHIYLQTLPRFGGNTVRGAMRGTGGGSAAVFVVCAAVVWPVGTLLGYHIRLLALNVTTIEQLRNSAHAALASGPDSGGPGPNAFSLGKWTRNAAWGACRPAGMSWVEGWKPLRTDGRILLGADEVV